MKKNLINFLFGESQVDDEIGGLVESIADMEIDSGGIRLKVDKKPLAKALKAIGIESDGLESDPRGLSLVFPDGDACRSAHKLLVEPDNMHKLAELGWVASVQGDVSQTNEPEEFRIRFLDIDNIEPENPKPDANAKVGARNAKISTIVKKGREFATQKPKHDDDMNPVEFDDKTSSDNQKGVGKAKAGANPEGKIKESVDALLEGGHKAGCKCNFCVNYKGKGFGPKKDKPTEPEKEAESGEVEESSENVWKCKKCGAETKSQRKPDVCRECKKKKTDLWLSSFDKKESAEESLKSPEEIVRESFGRRKNPGTPPGIMGHKSYPTMKLPKAYPDRKFAPAKGMVQPDSAVVNKQSKRKVNQGK